MSELLVVNDSSFKSIVLDSSVPVLVEFGASWCGPCKKQLPILKQLAKDLSDTVKVVKVDIDDCPEETKYYGITSLPTMIVFENGVPVDTKTGLTNLTDLKNFLSKK